MLPTVNQILIWLDHFKYIVIFPLAIVEGPIVTILSGLLVYLGQMNFILAYVLLAAGDLVGDVLIYYLGKYGNRGFASRVMSFLGITRERVQLVEKKFLANPKKIFTIGKAAHG